MPNYSSFHILLILLVQSIIIAKAQDTAQIGTLNLTATRNSYCNSLPNLDISETMRKSVWDSIYSKSNTKIQQKIESWIDSSFDITPEQLFSDLSKYTVPWLTIAIASFLLSFLYLYITLKPNSIIDWIKTHAEEEFVQSTKKIHKIGILTIVILNLTIIICSIITIIYSGDIIDGLDYSSCYMSRAFDRLLNEDDSNFTGYNILQQDFTILSSHFTDFQTDLKTVYSSRQSSKLMSEQASLIAFNDQLKRNLPKSPLPIKTSSNGTSVVPSTESYFSTMKLFDYVLSNTLDEDYLTFSKYYEVVKQQEPDLFLIDQVDKINNYYDLTFQRLSSLENSSFALRDSKISNLFQKAKAQLTTNNGYLQVYAEKYLNFHENLATDINSTVRGILVITIMLIIICFTQTVLWLGFLINRQLNIKKIVDFSWFLCNILLIALLIINIFLHSHSQLSQELCIYFDGFVNYADIYDSQNIVNFAETKQELKNCLYNQGDIFQQLNLVSRITDIRTYTNSNTGIIDQISKINSNQRIFLQQMTNNSKSISSIMDGTLIDLEKSQLDKLESIITNFNSYKSNDNCIEFANKQCQDGSNPKTNSNQQYTSKCWHPSYLITKFSSSCVEQNEDFLTLKIHFQSQAQGWIQAQLQESQIISKNSDLNFELNKYIYKVEDLNRNQSSVLSSMTSLLKSTDCTFVKTEFNSMLDGMCVTYSYSISRVSALIIIIICALFTSTLVNCLTSFKVSQLDQYEEFASTKVIHLAGSSRIRASIELNQILHNESPMHVNSTQQEFK